MKQEILTSILKAFGLNEATSSRNFGSGLINSTYLLENDKRYILQKININVFTKPEIISSNIRKVSDFVKNAYPSYQFITPIRTAEGTEYFINEGEYWRLTPFIENSQTFDQLTKPEFAYEAAKAVGEFAKVTSELDVSSFGETIPSFHNLSFRYSQFLDALENGNANRIRQQRDIIERIKALNHICNTFEEIKTNPNIPLRIQHHDTKINNILFDKETHKSICLCDLDTVMPGYFISDLGDMMRTYLSAASEEEQDLDKVKVRPDYYKALVDGYLAEMSDTLTIQEKKYIHYAGEFLIYMQALRFFTDYLNDDIYYATTYPENNLNRTLNQLKLLSSYQKLN